MIEIKLDKLHIKIETREYAFLSFLKEHFSAYAPGYRFSPKYEAGVWDGKIYLLRDRKLPYGLLSEVLKIHKKHFNHIPLKLDPSLYTLFKGESYKTLDLTSLCYEAVPHQEECIKLALQYGKGIIRACTGAGKSLVMAYIIKN